MQVEVYPELEFQYIVDFLTTEKDIESSTESAGVTTIFTSSTLLLQGSERHLTSGMYVKIGTINYKVSNVIKNTSFEVTLTSLIETKYSLALEYRYGTLTEVDDLLVLASQKPEEQLSRFPLLWNIIDANNKRDKNNNSPIDFIRTMKLSMINLTDKSYDAEKRLINNFIPTLTPYYNLILETIQSSFFGKVFYFEQRDYLNVQDWLRYFYGSASKNLQVFEATTDAIEFNIELAFQKRYDC